MAVVRDQGLRSRVDMLRRRFNARDVTAATVLHVRRGDFDKVDPQAFSADFPRPIVANKIEINARHMAAALSVMPSFRCRASSAGASDASKKRADKRTSIVNHYMTNARMQVQMQTGADHLPTFGMIVTQVTPDFDEQMPVPIVRDSLGFYPVWDGLGRTVEAAHVFRKRIVDLKAEYPEFLGEFERYNRFSRTDGDSEVEVYHHDDGKQISLLVPECDNLVLHRMANPVGRCLFVCTRRATIDGEIHGAWDDQVWTQLALNQAEMLALEAAEKAVDAPIVLPLDVADFAMGPDATIRTANPAGVGRVRLDLPQSAFGVVERLERNIDAGSLVPEALSGSIDASVVTGRGVQELSAGYSQQVAMFQETLVWHHTAVGELCFRMDEALWPDVEKKVSGYKDGAEYQLTYTPSKDIDGNYQVDVTYGTSTGLDPNRHLVFLLQQYGAGVMSKDTLRRELGGNINAADEFAKIAVEQGRDALMNAVAGLASAIPGLAAEGQDPSPVVAQIAQFVNLLEKGKPLEEIAVKVWPQPEPQAEAPAADPLAALMGGGAPQGGGDPMAGLGQNPDNDLQMFMAGLTPGGNPNLGAMVSRRAPAA